MPKFEKFLKGYHAEYMSEGYTTDELHMVSSFWIEAYKLGIVDGATKQAILELQGRDKFLEGLKKEKEIKK